MSTGSSNALSFDDILVKYAGEFGRYQLKLLLISSLMWIPNCLVILFMVFHSSPDPITSHYWQCTNSSDTACLSVYSEADPSAGFCTLARSQYEWTHKSRSILSQFDLVCSRAWQAQLANSIFFFGYLIGSGFFGSLADSRGRKRSNLLCLAIAVSGALLTGISPNFGVYTFFRFITGIGAAGQALTTYILATESIGPKWRGIAGVATQLYFTAGEFVLVLVAVIFKDWRALCFACAAISAAAAFLFPWIPESPRWLLVKGRVAEANNEIRKIAATNGAILPANVLPGEGGEEGGASRERGLGTSDRPHNSNHGNGNSGGYSATAGVGDEEATGREPDSMALDHGVISASSIAPSVMTSSTSPDSTPNPPTKLTLRMILKDSHILRRFLILSYVWAVLCLGYYGISLALGGLPGSIYATFCISAAAEFIANVLAAWLIEKIGRHNTMAGGMLLGGLSCVICSIVPAGNGQAILASIGKFGCSAAFTVASIYTSEMFPTLVRSAVLGVENEAARVGGIAAPFIVLAGTTMHKPAVPFVIFGVTMLVGGVSIFTLPETLGTALPDTMQDMDQITSVFTTRPWQSGGGWQATAREMFRFR
eukprot:CAMPEP_0175043076 /NCGR_PEP_ID=MMETSP0052_2-20121109/2958_1 /TAXON_ID=51329 ORGANISM="Polytomella parva, Strain SAG 63-3" /NCGR_SAMPLE_ID=MMETSP0052_2 /ASSEMBLY_ACC=CAM_ASM_000194 /LENGTH=596 /DNA_ID=CAMNT_0016306039 /DNA_START=194 /DNA_END=1981 /DNA_ORIENTATION=+